MATISNLPQETLHDIISYLDHDYDDLLNCSLTCRALWNVATAALYRDINLSFNDNYGYPNSATERRPFILLETLAHNPTIAAQVRSFQNDNEEEQADVVCSPQTDIDLILAAAKNMTQLTKAILTPNPLTVQIITNIHSYKLQILTIQDLDPRKYIWSLAPTSLRSLTWRMDVNSRKEQPWNATQFLITILEATCPNLEYLNIRPMAPKSHFEYRELSKPTSLNSVQYVDLLNSSEHGNSLILRNLRHFEYDNPHCNDGGDTAKNMRQGLLKFVTKYHHTLKAITFPVRYLEGEKSILEYILQVCSLLPLLKDLKIITKRINWGFDINGLQFLEALSHNSIVRNLERLSIADVYVPFSAELGQIFHDWPCLKFLRLGDANNKDGPFGQDDYLQFDAYAPHILAFIKRLPPSLEELYLEVNGENLICTSLSDLNPIGCFGVDIFTSLPRLHTCDIHAWVSDTDMGLGSIPEKAVFYRRLPHVDVGGRRVKEVWTSRMDCIYQEEDVNVRKACQEVEEPEVGFWMGRDAKEVWCGGFEFQEVEGAWRGRVVSNRDCWPFFRNVVREYDMFKKWDQ